VPSLADPLYAGLVQGIERQALAAGFWTIIQNRQGDAEREAEAVATLMSLKLAGAIVIPLGHSSRDGLYRQMSNAGIVTLAIFTCQSPDALMGRRQGNQWFGEFHGGTGPLQNPLFLANVTMPSALATLGFRTPKAPP
jgi:ABC-type sugar transport system substrate-binding protein